jgi:hypothetical protein
LQRQAGHHGDDVDHRDRLLLRSPRQRENGIVILAASRIGRLFSATGRWRRLPQILLEFVFAGLAVRLAIDSRR